MRRSPPTALIIGDDADEGTFALARSVAERAPSLRVVHLTATDLALAAWRHTIAPTGKVETAIRLPKTTIKSDTIVAAWYRAGALPMPRFAIATAGDRDYGASELLATIVSFLGALGSRVVNRPSGVCPTGPGWSDARWLAECRRVGLPTVRRIVSSRIQESVPCPGTRARATLFEGAGTNPFAGRYAGALRDLAMASGCRSMSLEYCCGPEPEVAQVDPVGRFNDQEDVHTGATLVLRMAFEGSYSTGRQAIP